MKNNRIRFVCMGLMTSLLLSLSGCGETTEDPTQIILEHDEEAITYSYESVIRGNVTKTERINCVYKQTSEQEVSFAVSGKYVDQVYVKKGDEVKKGTLLAELSSDDLTKSISDLEYRIKRNELQLSYLDTNEANEIAGMWVNYLFFGGNAYESQEAFLKRRDSVQQNYRYRREDLQDALDVDKMELSKKKADLKNSRVYADIDGVIYKIKDNLRGTTSKKDEVIIRIVDTDECVFETESTAIKSFVKEGDIISMKIVYGRGMGSYEIIPYKIDEWDAKQFFKVLDGPEDAEIEVDTSGTIYLVTGYAENVLTIPKDTVHMADDKEYVYVLGADGTREMKWIETGLIGDTMAEIVSGLEDGEKVIRK